MVGQEPDDYRPRRAAEEPPARSGSTAVSPPQTHAAAAGRGRLALMIAAVAVVAAVGLAWGYAVLGPGQDREGAAPPIPPGSPSETRSAAPKAPSSAASADPAVVLSEEGMLTTKAVRRLEAGRTWKVAATQRGLDPTSPQPACLADPVEGQQGPLQTVFRLLSSSGKNSPDVLHRASAYPGAAEAAQAYATARQALGECAVAGSWIDSAATITGLGDDALGVVVRVSDGSTVGFHSVVLVRTGRVVDIVDAARPSKAVRLGRLAEALVAPVNAQCQAAEGTCAERPITTEAPPPPGGNEPGFLTAGDLPPVGEQPTLWVGDQPKQPDDGFVGSQCETVDWAAVPARKRAWRTYVQAEGTPTFGLDEILLTLADAKAADKLVARVRKDLRSCESRKLTASVADLTPVRGRDADEVAVSGWATTVTQKTSQKPVRFRVGMVSAGRRVAFVFLNPSQGLDFTASEFVTVTSRAGERSSQTG